MIYIQLYVVIAAIVTGTLLSFARNYELPVPNKMALLGGLAWPLTAIGYGAILLETWAKER